MAAKTAKYNERPAQNSQGSNESGQNLRPMQDMMEYFSDYARANPEAAALWCFGIGFILGWKLKPW